MFSDHGGHRVGAGGGLDTYSEYFQVVPAPLNDRLEKGAKVLLPHSVLDAVSTKRVVYPLQFRVRTYGRKTTHCGVLEFVATEGQVVMPRWMMRLLEVNAGDPVQLETVALPKGGLCKLRPREYKFTELHNPRVVLESVLKGFACLSTGDSFPVAHGSETFTMDVMDLKTDRNSVVEAASIIDTDLKVEFERPLDMPDSPVRNVPAGSPQFPVGASDLTFTPQTDFAPPTLGATPNLAGAKAAESKPSVQPAFSAFVGSGRTLSGKPATNPSTAPPMATANTTSSTNTNTTTGAGGSSGSSGSGGSFAAFQGKGRSLKG